ncbi:MAG: 50S ribosomal protein L31 [Armatimonadetes bacterium]|nr:50S ribosomal protein L31 [Armatimonadota bacterium]
MKEAIHPKWVESKVSCACGESFVTYSTKPTIKVDICSKCHPFFTGRQKIVDKGGRVERFKKRYEQKEAPVAAAAVEPKAKAKIRKPRARKDDVVTIKVAPDQVKEAEK